MTKKAFQWTRIALAAFCLIGAGSLSAADKPAGTEDSTGLKIGFVNFRKCVEESKIGKQQQAAFEGLQNQMEASLNEIQKTLNEVTTKLSDEDYLDGLSAEAENELKHKYRALSQELSRTQGQYVQTLQDANMKVIQLISNEVSEAAKEVAKTKNLDLIVNEEAAFYHKPSMDLSPQVIVTMDAKFEKEQKANPAAKAPVPTPAPASATNSKK